MMREEKTYINNIIEQAFKLYADGTNDYEMFEKGFLAALDWIHSYKYNREDYD